MLDIIGIMKERKDIKRRRWRPETAGPGRGQPLLVRVHPELLDPLDSWIAFTGGEFSRPEALRRLAEMALQSMRGRPVRQREETAA
jgi:hypothetical protein